MMENKKYFILILIILILTIILGIILKLALFTSNTDSISNFSTQSEDDELAEIIEKSLPMGIS